MEAVAKSKPAGGEGPPGIQIVKASNDFLKVCIIVYNC